MMRDEIELADRIDRFWDGLALGTPSTADGPGASLAGAIQRFHALSDDPMPSLTLRRLDVGAFVARHPPRPATPRPATSLAGAIDRLRSWGHQSVALAGTIVLVVLIAGGGLLSVRLAAPSPSGQSAAPIDLFVTGDFTDGGFAARLSPLDPGTLADLPSGDPIEIGNARAFDWSLSGDGSTLATVEGLNGSNGNDLSTTVVIRDGRTGAERLRFRTTTPVGTPVLSNEGTRLVTRAWEAGRWYVFDTADGRLVATFLDGSNWGTWIDPSVNHMYQLVPFLGSAVPGRLWTASLVAYDLNTGQKSGRLDLPGILIGARTQTTTEDTASGEQRVDEHLDQLWPGGALSPDGKHLAIVHADADVMTIVDTERFVVERTMPLTRPTTWQDRVVSWLPLAPQDASAKGGPYQGTSRSAVFSPDGLYLYVFGARGQLDGDGGSASHGLGIMRVEVESGQVVTEGLAAAQLVDVVPSPDGRTLYVIGPEEPRFPYDIGPDPLLLRRLDAQTLEIRAEREVHGWSSLLVRSGSPGEL